MRDVVRRFAEKLRRMSIRGRVRLGIPVPIRSEDRFVLEQRILPFYAGRADVQRVLFAGTAWYTAHYRQLFAGHEYWTIDPVPSRREYGSDHHIVDTLARLPAHVAEGHFDLIVVNGVIGYGLNDPMDVEASVAAVHRCLRTGGHLLLGWDDVDARRVLAPEQIVALAAFSRLADTPFGRYRCAIADDNRKTYDFYVKR